jgi:Methyltransferase domain
MTFDYPGRGRYSDACVACGSPKLQDEWTVTSPFFARRALLRDPHVVILKQCLDCKTRYFDFMATDQELQRLYADYRGENYFQERHGFEPWYTKSLNDGMGGDEEMEKRRKVLLSALARANIPNSFSSVLDHGGDRGQMLRNLAAPRKAVYDISGVGADPGIEKVGETTIRSTSWNLILSCHVLEHLSDPAAYIDDLKSLGQSGSTYFIEVPNEPARSASFNASAAQRRWLIWLCARPQLLRFLDFVSTGVRARFGMIPPFCFFPLREHLSFFSVKGLISMLQKRGLDVRFAGVMSSGHIAIVAKLP